MCPQQGHQAGLWQPLSSVKFTEPHDAECTVTAADASCSMAAAEAGASTPGAAAPGENPSDERIQQLASVATGQQFTTQPDGSMPGLPPQQFPPGIDPINPAHQPLLPFDQPPPVPVPVQSKEQEMAIMRERNDGLPLSKEESDDEVHPLPDAASGFRCPLPPQIRTPLYRMHSCTTDFQGTIQCTFAKPRHRQNTFSSFGVRTIWLTVISQSISHILGCHPCCCKKQVEHEQAPGLPPSCHSARRGF